MEENQNLFELRCNGAVYMVEECEEDACIAFKTTVDGFEIVFKVNDYGDLYPVSRPQLLDEEQLDKIAMAIEKLHL